MLYAIHKSGFKKNATVKGGVVMCELTTEARRTTMDLDLDFVHCSISEASIRRIVARWARLTGLRIAIFGTVSELRQEDYRGKRVYVDISDGTIRRPVRTKVDIGVHTHEEIRQEERRFQALAEDRAALMANSKEQIFIGFAGLKRQRPRFWSCRQGFRLYNGKDFRKAVERLKASCFHWGPLETMIYY